MQEDFQVIVIGGGTSGLMAAISSAEAGAEVLLLEKNKKLGKKLLLTGGGRCNVTNCHTPEEIIQHIPGNGKFLFSAFHQFDNQDIMAFFAENGVALKEEDHGRMFPVTDRSKTIVNCLEDKCRHLGVTIQTGETVTSIQQNEGKITGVKTLSGAFYACQSVIITTGGKTHRHTGSTGDGYEFAKRLGHTITPLYPTEVPLTSPDTFTKKEKLQGVSLQDVALSVLNQKGKKIVTHRMDFLFTHFGISGPATLRCSSFVVKELEKQSPVELRLDLFPDDSEAQVFHKLTTLIADAKEKVLKNALKNFLPERLLRYFFEFLGIDENLPAKQLDLAYQKKLATLCKNFPIHIDGTWPLEKAFVTGGGVNLKEISPQTLESKIVAGLFFAGEVLDINGYTGGYNITAAFVTGHVAGTHAAYYGMS